MTYAEVSNGGQRFTLVVRFSGGQTAKIELSFIVFQNKDRRYPIRGTPDDVENVSYRTNPNGWIESLVFSEWLTEPKSIQALPDEK